METSYRARRRVLFFLISLLFVISASLVGFNISVDARLEMQGPTQTPAAPVEKTVEQVQKNIQVLNGLPHSQLGTVMNYIASSLGVECTYCHVKKDDKWDFPSDEKPEKGVAREMIKMVQGINKANFKGNPVVSCFTCHRGRNEPVRLPQLPLAETAHTPESPAPASDPKEARPTADQILARYTEALGGTALIEKIKTRSMKGTWLAANGVTLGYEVYQSAPDKVYALLTTPKQGVIERGFDGQMGWEKSPHGLRDLQSRELLLLTRSSDLFKDIKLQGQFARINFAGKDKIDGQDVYVLRGQGIDGKGERLYFDVQSGLLLRRITITPTIVGLIPEQVDYEDYRDVAGLKVPFTIRISSVDSFFNSTRKLTEIKINVPVDETKFHKPAAAVGAPNP